MRKALIAVAVATALFAVGAFAASFAVQSEDVASGANDVVACASQVDIDFGPPTVDSATGVWSVTTATATFRNADDTTTNGCSGYRAELALKVSGVTTSVDSTPVAAASSSVGFEFSPTNVQNITAASIVVDGKNLAADVPAPT